MEFINKIKVKMLHYTWRIAYGHYDESIITQGIDVSKLHIVKNPYKEKWFADPFILEDNENSFDLVEWVLFDSATESVYEKEVDKLYS